MHTRYINTMKLQITQIFCYSDRVQILGGKAEMAYAELNLCRYSSTLFSLSVVENKQANAGQGSQARLARSNSQAQTETRTN